MSRSTLVVMETHISAKEKGNDAFKRKDFAKAVEWYGEAIRMMEQAKEKENLHALFGNRSAAYVALKKYDDAIEDGKRSIDAKSSYVKGYYRLARAFEAKGSINKAIDTIMKGLAIDKGLFAADQSDRKQFSALKKLGKKLWDKLEFELITSYMFSDERTPKAPKTEVYISIEGVGRVPKSNVSCTFGRKTLDLKVRDVSGRNYRLCEPELWGEVNPDACKMIVKKNKIVLKLRKTNAERQWEKLGYG